jgi:hypothetical protein
MNPDKLSTPEANISHHISRYRRRLLTDAAAELNRFYADSPVDDYSTAQHAYEQGVADCIQAITNFRDGIVNMGNNGHEKF